ncbi:nucleoside-diphosphate kinase [bacterium (Candidatus Moisslbacteria) CG12_big_fil_rev_8_21_14_0_65_36_11]|nr:nucleoside-diphosphate kinase [Candidatus Kuenenbacteria bacterium]PIV45945.1 MAG: nucleoside-diphosphate kinase [bacterium (Candidatus Moisslbacteria) CG02_land_8_20_14_3_00_36_53]PIW67793.1 MAG: nucleoside-diphosphate kinase [bacterium (Candidatus Moisslbacteria) CG12_big_fil_rev_8_21_14_0_65_36_11]
MSMIEQTLILIKPDGLKKSLTGNILTRLSETKLKIVGAKVIRVSRELAEKHYAHLKGKPFFEELIKYLTGELHQTPRVLAMVYEGEEAIAKVKKLAGATNPEEAEPTSIRGAYGRILTSGIFENAIHASSGLREAEGEIKLWFKPEELVSHLYPVEEAVKEKIKELIWA